MAMFLDVLKDRRKHWMETVLNDAVNVVEASLTAAQHADVTSREFKFAVHQRADGALLLGDEKEFFIQLPKDKKTKEEILTKLRGQLEQEGISVNIDETIEISTDSQALSEDTVEIGNISVDLSE